MNYKLKCVLHQVPYSPTTVAFGVFDLLPPEPFEFVSTNGFTIRSGEAVSVDLDNRTLTLTKNSDRLLTYVRFQTSAAATLFINKAKEALREWAGTEVGSFIRRGNTILLHYVLQRVHRTLVFEVFYMNERFMGWNFLASNGVEVVSSLFPALSYEGKRVKLRGKRSDFGDNVAVLPLSSPEEAEEFLLEVQEALKEWGERWFDSRYDDKEETTTLYF